MVHANNWQYGLRVLLRKDGQGGGWRGVDGWGKGMHIRGGRTGES